ncbi:hypothetical protein Q7A53_10535 [Halobacillus rhizosphaerae]|uniref:hypothetical protein n=1 Tax=Halobacillus rhizosphaerae TaxID=3064889 RepID=UPI00398B1527
MNWAVIKDLKVALGFSLSLLLGLTAIILAIYDHTYSVLFIILAQIPQLFSVTRANKLTHSKQPHA